MADRDFDVVLFGATGFTGRLVAEWLTEHAPADLRWALAGRSKDKLERTRDALGPAVSDLPLIVADSSSAADMQALVARTKVVCTTVGPYMKYGHGLVAAAAAAGTHYCDLTGETPFIREMIAAHHDTAVASGARIVHCCGYDSIPSDLGAFMLQQDMIARGAPAERITTYVGPAKGGVSGGTIASMLHIMEMAKDRDTRRALVDPYSLDPADGKAGVDGRDQAGPVFDDTIDQWTTPFVMAAINTRVVRRTHAVLGYPWGDQFSYTETMSTGRGFSGRQRAYMVAAGLGGFMGLTALGPTRALLERFVLPAPGEGPDLEARERGFFRHLVVGQGKDPNHRGVARVIGIKDPGYGETAKMLACSALSLALDDLPDQAGILTPASAMGMAVVERMRSHGMTWSTEPWPADAPPIP